MMITMMMTILMLSPPPMPLMTMTMTIICVGMSHYAAGDVLKAEIHMDMF